MNNNQFYIKSGKSSYYKPHYETPCFLTTRIINILTMNLTITSGFSFPIGLPLAETRSASRLQRWMLDSLRWLWELVELPVAGSRSATLRESDAGWKRGWMTHDGSIGKPWENHRKTIVKTHGSPRHGADDARGYINIHENRIPIGSMVLVYIDYSNYS